MSRVIVALSLGFVQFLVVVLIASWKFVGVVVAEEEKRPDMYCETDGICTPISSSPVEDPCRDQSSENCSVWAMEGECRFNPTYMQSQCPRSCHVCPRMPTATKTVEELEEDELPESVPGCRDLHNMCRTWAEEGECLLNSGYMHAHCRKSCFLCVDVKECRRRGEDEDFIKRKRAYMNLDLGLQQSLAGNNDKERADTLAQLLAMDDYAKTNAMNLTEYKNCQNHMELCTYWASQGLCVSNIVFMMNTCPLACMECHTLHQFEKCVGKRHPDSPPAISSNVNDFFWKHKKSGMWDEYNVEFVSMPENNNNDNAIMQDPWLVRFDQFISEEECDRLVELGHEIGWSQSEIDEKENVLGNLNRQLPRLASKSATCPVDVTVDHNSGNRSPCGSDPIHERVLERISQVLGVSTAHFEGMQLVRYESNKASGLHHDFQIRDVWKPAGPRIFTVMLSLSDVGGGGGEGATGFPELDWLLIRSKKGQLILWPNVQNLNSMESDERMIHEFLPVVHGENYVANVWVHMYDWLDALERHCV